MYKPSPTKQYGKSIIKTRSQLASESDNDHQFHNTLARGVDHSEVDISELPESEVRVESDSEEVDARWSVVKSFPRLVNRPI